MSFSFCRYFACVDDYFVSGTKLPDARQIFPPLKKKTKTKYLGEELPQVSPCDLSRHAALPRHRNAKCVKTRLKKKCALRIKMPSVASPSISIFARRSFRRERNYTARRICPTLKNEISVKSTRYKRRQCDLPWHAATLGSREMR